MKTRQSYTIIIYSYIRQLSSPCINYLWRCIICSEGNENDDRKIRKATTRYKIAAFKQLRGRFEKVGNLYLLVKYYFARAFTPPRFCLIYSAVVNKSEMVRNNFILSFKTFKTGRWKPQKSYNSCRLITRVVLENAIRGCSFLQNLRTVILFQFRIFM